MTESKKPYHDPVTGMYTYPEPERTDTSDFREHAVEMPDGEQKNILIPPAGLKPSRTFFAVVNGVSQNWTVQESADEIKAAINHAKSDERVEWYKFTDPIFGRDLHISAISLQNVLGIMEDMTDLQRVRDQIAQEEYAKAEFRKASLDMKAQSARTIIRQKN